MGLILGELRILHIKRIGGEWQQVAHLTSNSLDIETDFLETTTRENKGFATQIPILISSSISFEAIMFEDEDVGLKAGYKILRELQKNKEKFEWKLEALNRNFTETGFGYIASLSESAPVDDTMTYSGSISVYGQIFEGIDEERPLAPVLSLSIIHFPLTAQLSWTESFDNFGVIGYELEKTQNGVKSYIDVGNVLSYNDLGVAYFTKISYRVRAYDAANNFSLWSNSRLFYLTRIPSEVPEFEYMQYENGVTIFDELNIPLTYE